MEQDKNNNIQVSTEFEPHIAAALSYLIPPITGVVFYIREKNNKFVRFHAFQSILFGVAAYLLYWTFSISIFTFMGFFIRRLLSVGLFGIWIFLMWKAFNKEEFEIPFLGKIAREQSQK